MTNIQVEGALGIDIAKIMLVIGLIAIVIAIIQIIRTTYNSRR